MKKICGAVILMLCICAVTHAAGILRVGDVLEIYVQDHLELSKKVMIQNDGTIDYPLFSDKSVTGMTTMEVAELLTFRLAKSIQNPFVLVSTTDAMPIQVRVLGQVNKPGIVQLAKGATLQEVIMAAGGPTQYADLADLRIIRDKGTDADAISVDYKEFLEKGKLSAMPEIRPNDIVILLSAPRNLKVKILGDVARPGYSDIQGKTNLFDAIYLAGGPGEKANLSKVRHILKTDDKSVDEVIDMQEYIDKGKMDDIPLVKEGDVIIVYKKFFTWEIFLNIVRDGLMLFTAYHVFSGG